MGTEGKFSSLFFVSLVFSPEPNNGKFHFPSYFLLPIFHPPYFHPNQTDHSVWLKGWKSERIENCGRIENILISHIFIWLGVEKWRDGKNEFI